MYTITTETKQVCILNDLLFILRSQTRMLYNSPFFKKKGKALFFKGIKRKAESLFSKLNCSYTTCIDTNLIWERKIQFTRPFFSYVDLGGMKKKMLSRHF